MRKEEVEESLRIAAAPAPLAAAAREKMEPGDEVEREPAALVV